MGGHGPWGHHQHASDLMVGAPLDQEAELARRLAAPQRMVDLIEDAKARLGEIPEQIEMMGALERALVAAADSLPDIRDLDAAERAAARG